ncbi:alpha-E domain-containing protein [Segetibacter sp. 3557_3]|uniref:alpha-E domain-containing protein n=1 Tax=Segetibacter sp. 3557_3 TaxID=2547429 RepID=UPI0010587DE4|nr:alpha-E domain-containing protein [Segetibacter sp. 3557_3]TDH26078.1 alpha-E domain-containing protein [Segetibacter sp. 3557_3]
MLSRVAETIYWQARYMERTSSMLQVLRTNYIASQDQVHNFPWRPIILQYGQLTNDEGKAIENDSRQVLEYLIFDKSNIGSAYNNIVQARENARSIQDHITKEVWQCLNDFYHFIKEPYVEQEVKFGDPLSAIDEMIKKCLLYTGTVDNTMTRDEGFTFMNIGKLLERSIQITDVLRIKLTDLKQEANNPGGAPGLRYLLYSLYGFEIFLKTYKGKFNAQSVLHLLLYNTDFPHSVLYSLDRLYRLFERLKPESLPENYEQLDFLIGKTINSIKYTHINTDNPLSLGEFLFKARTDLVEIAGSFSKFYFGKT